MICGVVEQWSSRVVEKTKKYGSPSLMVWLWYVKLQTLHIYTFSLIFQIHVFII